MFDLPRSASWHAQTYLSVVRESKRESLAKRLTRVLRDETSLDVSGIVYWETERSNKAEKDSSRVLVPAGRDVLDS